METERKRRKRKRKESKRLNDLMRLLFFAYIGFMIWILFVQRMESTNGIVLEGGYSLNIIPFKTIKVYFDAIHSTTSSFAIRQLFVALAANVVLFIPLGFFLPCIWKKLRSFFKAAGVIVAIIVAVELIQFITFVGSCDIDDLLLNTSGAWLGYPLWKKFWKKNSK